MLAATQGRLLLFLNGQFYRRHVGALMTSIAKWLVLTIATTAKPVITSFQFN